jgi:hypothetical protein
MAECRVSQQVRVWFVLVLVLLLVLDLMALKAVGVVGER